MAAGISRDQMCDNTDLTCTGAVILPMTWLMALKTKFMGTFAICREVSWLATAKALRPRCSLTTAFAMPTFTLEKTFQLNLGHGIQ